MLTRPKFPFAGSARSRPELARGSAAALLVVLALLVLAPGCGASAAIRLRSAATEAELAPRARLIAYVPETETSADIYLTDLDPADLEEGADPAAAGQIVHLRLFMVPRAGRTPIDRAASTCTIRHVVIAGSAVGVYGGGGFLLPSGQPGDEVLGGSIRDGTVRLVESTPDFNDVLGPSLFSATVRAPLDPSLARAIARRLDEALRAVSAGGSGGP